MGLQTQTAVIANGQTVSSAVHIGGRTIAEVQFPAMTGTAVTLTECETQAGTFVLTCDKSAQISITVGAAARNVHNLVDLFGIEWLKFTSGSAEGAERTITVKTVDVVS